MVYVREQDGSSGPRSTAGQDERPKQAEAGGTSKKKTRYLRRQKDPFSIIEQIKLWPSKQGVLHGLRSVKLRGGVIVAQTHCGQTIRLKNSRNSRLARQLRNKTYDRPCKRCRIPAWKIEKFSETSFV